MVAGHRKGCCLLLVGYDVLLGPISKAPVRIVPMNAALVFVLAIGGLFLAADAQSPARDLKAIERVRHILLHSRHTGAHGIGYNTQSLNSLSKKLTPADIPTLVELLAEKDLTVGVQFGLASQCSAAITPIREAAAEHKMTFLDAEDAMRLIEDRTVCTSEARQSASAMRAEIHRLGEAEHQRLEEEARQKEANDARIQRNALKMMNPEQATELTRTEREEVYWRSLKAMGLKEGAPMTPAQKDLVQRMYRTMVLGESGDRPSN
jgi:hypothetical protein